MTADEREIVFSDKDTLADYAIKELSLALDKRQPLEVLVKKVEDAEAKKSKKTFAKMTAVPKKSAAEFFKDPQSGMVLKVSEHPWLADPRKGMIYCNEDGDPA